MGNQKEYRKKLIERLKELEEKPLAAKQFADDKSTDYFSSEAIAKGAYKGCEITTDGFKDFDHRDAEIIKFKISYNKRNILFVFAIASPEKNYFKENKIDIYNTALETIEEKIDKGLNKTPYFFELRQGKIDENINPEWWKGTKQHFLE